jgi:hypothetical protein
MREGKKETNRRTRGKIKRKSSKERRDLSEWLERLTADAGFGPCIRAITVDLMGGRRSSVE